MNLKLRTIVKLVTFLITVPYLLSACSTATKNPSSNELYLISHPTQKTLTKIDALIPSAMKWYDEVSKSLYAKGRVLTKAEKRQAKALGVKNPNAIRVVILEKFPEPNNHATTNNHFEGARAMGNIIMLKPKYRNNSTVLCHELVHVAQKDRMGLKQFLKQYALEREVLGYSRSLLEKEAYALQQPIH